MKISIMTLFPAMIQGFFEESIVRKAKEKGLVDIDLVNLRDFAIDSYGTVDDRPYGGGAGMVLRIEPISKALESIKTNKKDQKIILTSPRGVLFNQQKAKEYSTVEHLIIVAGHYEAIDERVTEYVDEEVSLGDFVLTGGEIVAATITDAVTRLIPGVLKKDDATVNESFFEVSVAELINVLGPTEVLKKLQMKKIEKVSLLEYAHYTRPEIFNGVKVPDALITGHHKEIQKWRIRDAYEKTLKVRPDLLDIRS